MTTREPGREARLDGRPDGQAARDRVPGEQPAPTMTVGFEVFVQLVMAAMATDPSLTLGLVRRPRRTVTAG